MPRGYVWCAYVADSGDVFALRVDADYQLQEQRGMVPVEDPAPSPLPRGWRPRRVLGLEPSGRRHTAVVGRLDADLWSGARGDFDVVDSNGDLQTCSVTTYLAENTRARP